MEILINLEKDDWKIFQSHIEKELRKSVKSWTDSFVFNVVLWAVLTSIFLSVFNMMYQFHWPTAFSVATFFVVFIISLIMDSIKLKKAFMPSEKGVFVGQHHFIFDNEGIKSKGKGYEGFHDWTIVKKIERSKGMILIYLDTTYAYVFPEKKLDNPDNFFNYINEQFNNCI